MSIIKTLFGTLPGGRPVDCYTIENQNGARAEILTYGGTLNRLYMPDRDGVLADVLIGFDTLEGHLKYSDYQGMLVGRYANRIADGTFLLNGEEYHVTKNENKMTCLHGGGEFSHAVWDAQPLGENALRLSYESPEGAQGFPGRVAARVVYTLTEDHALRIDYYAESNQDTILNLTNHAYFNLGGYDAGEISGHILRLNASHFTPTDARNIPTGELRDVDATPFDFREPKAIGDGIDSDYAPVASCKGYDHNFCIDHWDGTLREAGEVYEPRSGRVMRVLTDLPGVQLYTGNFLKGHPGKGGKPVARRTGFCLETQYYPDTPNQPGFPTCVFRAGEAFKSTTEFRFSVRES